MLDLHVHLTRGGSRVLRDIVKTQATGFWPFAEDKLKSATRICLWSEPQTNEFDELVMYRAAITGHKTTPWGKRGGTRVIEFDLNTGEFFSGKKLPEMPSFYQQGTAWTEQQMRRVPIVIHHYSFDGDDGEEEGTYWIVVVADGEHVQDLYIKEFEAYYPDVDALSCLNNTLEMTAEEFIRRHCRFSYEQALRFAETHAREACV